MDLDGFLLLGLIRADRASSGAARPSLATLSVHLLISCMSSAAMSVTTSMSTVTSSVTAMISVTAIKAGGASGMMTPVPHG